MIKNARLAELDLLRGIAIILMVIYHLVFDIWFLRLAEFNLYNWPLSVIGKTAAILFLLLVGVSLTVSYQKRLKNGETETEFTWHVLKRGLSIFSLGLGLSLITWLIWPEIWIQFGILHCIGLSIMLVRPVINRGQLVLWLALITGLVGLYFLTLRSQSSWGLWLGIRPVDFQTLDYYPLLPWVAIVLVGVHLGQKAYYQAERQFQLPRLVKGMNKQAWLVWLGRHSLLIYFVHQPALLMSLSLIKMMVG